MINDTYREMSGRPVIFKYKGYRLTRSQTGAYQVWYKGALLFLGPRTQAISQFKQRIEEIGAMAS